MRKIAVLFSSVLCFGLLSCEEKEDDKIFSAQQCLDSVALSGAPVDPCVDMLNGITTPKSYVIRCSADFIRQGITNDAIVTAIEDLDNNNETSGSDANVVLYDVFAFDPQGANSAEQLVDTAVENCTATGSETLTILAISAKTATTIEAIAGGDIQTWLDGNPDINALTGSNPAELVSIGESVIAIQPIACGKGGQFEGTEVCDNLTSAINAGSDPSTIAQQFLNDLSNPNN